MIPILGGLGAALCWGASTVVASRSTRILGSQQALAYVMLLGFVALALLAPVSGLPAHAGSHRGSGRCSPAPARRRGSR